MKKPMSIKVFSMDPELPAQEYNFRTHKNIVSTVEVPLVTHSDVLSKSKIECSVLTNVQEIVEANYVNDRPRHHLPSARNVVREPGSSIFFLVDYNEYLEMPASTIQQILKDRHIVVQNVPQKSYTWGPEALSLMGSLTQARDLQGDIPAY